MHILIINPNSSASMTDAIGRAARRAASARTAVSAINPVDAPPAIQGPADGEAALPALFTLFEEKVLQRGAYDAVVIACFDDTGLMALKARSPVPVIGIGEAAFHAAMLVAERFSVVTTLEVSVPVIEGNIARYGFAGRCARVRSSGVPVLDLEDADHRTQLAITQEITRALEEDDAGAIVLGCAGMAELATALSRDCALPVIDGVTAAVGLAECLVHCGIGNSGLKQADSSAGRGADV